MVKVKICGIKTVEDALWAARCGADALGLNFVRGTPRCIEPDIAQKICHALPPFVAKVGVFVNPDPVEIQSITDSCRLDYVQLHGDETPDFCNEINYVDVIKAFRVCKTVDLSIMKEYTNICAYLLDARVEGMMGGTGRRINPELARKAAQYGPVILAGGLNPENVAEAVNIAAPFAVDAASGVENAPGMKSKTMVKQFINNAKFLE